MKKSRDRKALSIRPATTATEVGYGRPPEHSRFKPGTSGNPRGRPKGAKNKLPALHEERMKSILMEEAYRTIKVNDGSRQVSVPMAQAVIRSLAVNAVKGNQRAQRLFTELLSATEQSNRRLHDEWMEVAIKYKLEWEQELERRNHLGIVAPDPIPHPDHVIIDVRRNEVRITGPMTKEEKAKLEMWKARKADFEAELKDWQNDLRRCRSAKNRQIIQEQIALTNRVLEAIRNLVED